MSNVHEQRLASPSACRWCGETTTSSTRVAGWRTCRRCESITASPTHGALWRLILNDKTVTDAEGFWLTTEGLLVNPAFFVTDPETFWTTGNRKGWAHLPDGLADDARAALRRHRDGTGMRRHPKGPCTICGRRRDEAWMEPPSERGKPVCGSCAYALRRYGWPTTTSEVTNRADVVTALCLGWPVTMGLGRRIPVAAYGEWRPDGDGNDDPWGHVPAEDRREARIRLTLSGSVGPLTDDERAEVDRRRDEAAMEWAEQVTPRGPIRLTR